MSIRKRLTPREVRGAALEAAEAILLESGPQALTLKAVAARIGRTHANLLHHFGSASGLHDALGRHMADRHTAKIAEAIRNLHEGRGTVHDMVEGLFESNNEHGGLHLMSWLSLTRNEAMLDPVMQSLKGHIDEFSSRQDIENGVVDLTMLIHLVAIGDSVMGEAMTRMLGTERSRPREIVTAIIENWTRATGWKATSQLPEQEVRAAE
ncbi:hypothetical protein MB02_05855 [Croceicoccus estronivorus]|uniref:TetR/AcrR family transcriptional regulator n=1 Tax=Croceicoccus estronivorus TaxID=1172626 RepID=UPI00082F0F74|nr:TetR family transcriptional regulator [Croceicoccus estronivorus]OCC24964.1 hypothetical protein MB02_05855 [Croceicoccus estronivorus]